VKVDSGAQSPAAKTESIGTPCVTARDAAAPLDEWAEKGRLYSCFHQDRIDPAAYGAGRDVFERGNGPYKEKNVVILVSIHMCH